MQAVNPIGCIGGFGADFLYHRDVCAHVLPHYSHWLGMTSFWLLLLLLLQLLLQKLGTIAMLTLAYESIGIIYGDIGTSPLYTYASTLTGPPTTDEVLGVASLIFWTITVIVVLKYAFIVLLCDDNGEGETRAVMAVAHVQPVTLIAGAPP